MSEPEIDVEAAKAKTIEAADKEPEVATSAPDFDVEDAKAKTIEAADKAKEEIIEAADKAKEEIIEAADKAKEVATSAFASADELGFFSHFNEYVGELMMPWSTLMANESFTGQPTLQAKGLYLFEVAKAEVMGHMALDPPTPKESFRLYNVLSFWLGVVESLIFALFGHGIISLAWNGAVGFAIAYTLYWTMTQAQVQKLQFWAMVLIALYIGFNVYMGLSTLLYLVPAVLYFSKAFCDVLMFINGYKLYKSISPADSPAFMGISYPKEMF